MPDLHGWITRQIDETERGQHEGRVVLDEQGRYDHTVFSTDPAVLRRCAADRKILEVHAPAGTKRDPYACNGCGVDSEYGHEVDHTNDCPTLQALAEGYGLTEEQAAQLDRPEPRPPVDLGALIRLMSTKPTSSVPPALRGPNWKA